MNIQIINPDFGMTRPQLARRERMLARVCHPGTTLRMDCLRRTPVTIDSLADVALASPEILEMGLAAARNGCDAVVLYCFSDPALAALREVLDIPVVGAGQVSLYQAAGLGYRFSLLTTTPARNPEKRQFVKSCGLEPDRLASVRSAPLSFDEMVADRQGTLDKLARAAALCLEDGADSLVLGCLSLAGMAEDLSRTVGVPVVDPAFAGVAAAQAMVLAGLTHSKLAYPPPPPNPSRFGGDERG